MTSPHRLNDSAVQNFFKCWQNHGHDEIDDVPHGTIIPASAGFFMERRWLDFRRFRLRRGQRFRCEGAFV
jgi:hypothetical protein